VRNLYNFDKSATKVNFSPVFRPSPPESREFYSMDTFGKRSLIQLKEAPILSPLRNISK